MRSKLCKKHRGGITVGELVPMLDKDCRISIGCGAAAFSIDWDHHLTRYAYGDLLVSRIDTFAAGNEVHIEIEVTAVPLVRH